MPSARCCWANGTVSGSSAASEIERLSGLASQAAMAIRNARVHAREEEEHHIQKDVVLVGFGQWGQKAYKHLVLLKSFFNFRTHVVEADLPGRRQVLSAAEETVLANGDLFYWDSPTSPAHDALALELEPSCYVITYIATPAETHLPLLKSLLRTLQRRPDRETARGAAGRVPRLPRQHRRLGADRGGRPLLVQDRGAPAGECYSPRSATSAPSWTRSRRSRSRSWRSRSPDGSGAQIGMIADLIPHAFAVLSLLTPLDRLQARRPPTRCRSGAISPCARSTRPTRAWSARSTIAAEQVRVTIDVGKGVTNAKWIKLSGERRMGGRRSFYKFDFIKGEAIDGTQSALRAAMRPIRQPGVPDNAHLSMLRHVMEKRHPAVGILSIREALRANARIQQIEQTAADLIAAGNWMPYEHGQRPAFPNRNPVQMIEPRESVAHATGE